MVEGVVLMLNNEVTAEPLVEEDRPNMKIVNKTHIIVTILYYSVWVYQRCKHMCILLIHQHG